MLERRLKMRLTIVIALLAGVRTDRITTCNVGSNVCECTGDDFTLDISTYANYPIYKIPDLSPPGYDVYVYTYSPCDLIACTKGGTVDSYITICIRSVIIFLESINEIVSLMKSCQYGYNHTFSNARNAPAQWEINQWEPLQFTLQYQGGDAILSYKRIMQMTFTYANTTPVIVMESNTVTDQYIFYNFNFTGDVVKFT